MKWNLCIYLFSGSDVVPIPTCKFYIKVERMKKKIIICTMKRPIWVHGFFFSELKCSMHFRSK